MKGWKTWTGAALIGLSAALTYLGCNGCDAMGALLLKIGGAIAVVGVAHKIEKAGGNQ